jgi:hypothetical protein
VHEPCTRLERARKWLPPAESEQLKQLLLVKSEDGARGNDEDETLTKAGLATHDVITTFYDAGIETADAYVGFRGRPAEGARRLGAARC